MAHEAKILFHRLEEYLISEENIIHSLPSLADGVGEF